VTRPTPLQIALWAGFLAAVLGIVLLPSGLRGFAAAAAIIFAAANIATQFWVFRTERRQVEGVLAAHEGETVIGTGLLSFDHIPTADRARVRAVIAARDGLSFRDANDVEVAQLAASRIMSVELAPLEPRKVRPAVVTLIDGAPVRFFVGGSDDQQAQNIMAIRAALGRSG
jgi:hypothetical protein